MEKQHRQAPPGEVVIPMPNTTGAGDDIEKRELLGGSPSSQDTWTSAQTLRGSTQTSVPETGSEAPAAKFPTHTRILDDCPEGYPRLACFTSSDHNFMIYRSFSYLHARCLHYIQDELACLERDLDDLDERDDKLGGVMKRRLAQRGREDWENGERAKLVRRIKEKLDEYDGLLSKARELVSFQRPSNRDYRSVRTFFDNEQPLVKGEQKYIECKEDLVTLRNGRECAGFDGFVENVIQALDCKFMSKFMRWIFLTPELRVKTSNKNIHYFSPQRLDKVVSLLIAVIILTLLILPVIALVVLGQHNKIQQSLHGEFQQDAAALMVFRSIGVLMVFTLAFSAVMSMLTKARRHEIFASSAAYCAVLVVFVGNLPGLAPGSR